MDKLREAIKDLKWDGADKRNAVIDEVLALISTHPPDDAGEKYVPAKTPDGIILTFGGEPLGVPSPSPDAGETIRRGRTWTDSRQSMAMLDEHLADAGEWRECWECDVCGYLYKAPRPHGDNCIGDMHRIDRRAPWDGTERRKGEAELRKIFGDLMRSHAWYTAREYERDTTYNNQSPGYKEEEAANNWFIEKYGADAFYADMTVHPDKSGERGKKNA
jgi:hypothetical protein